MSANPANAVIPLPEPTRDGGMTLARALSERRTVREFGSEALALEEASQLLWAAQGVTGPNGLRTTPSGGALFPLELHLVAGAVAGLAPGAYRYVPDDHTLEPTATGDRREHLSRAALGQSCVSDAPATLVLSAVYPRITSKYGPRGRQYALQETGHAAQNVLLQATALGMIGVPVGAFEDETARQALDLPAEEIVLYLLPVGRR